MLILPNDEVEIAACYDDMLPDPEAEAGQLGAAHGPAPLVRLPAKKGGRDR